MITPHFESGPQPLHVSGHLGKVEMYTEHSAPPGQLNLAPKSQSSEHATSREHIAATAIAPQAALALEKPPSYSGGAHC